MARSSARRSALPPAPRRRRASCWTTGWWDHNLEHFGAVSHVGEGFCRALFDCFLWPVPDYAEHLGAFDETQLALPGPSTSLCITASTVLCFVRPAVEHAAFDKVEAHARKAAAVVQSFLYNEPLRSKTK